MNSALSHNFRWFDVNNLMLNGIKTKCVEFTLPNVEKHNFSFIIKEENQQNNVTCGYIQLRRVRN